MPKRSDIKRVLVIGSGPIVIGQAAEFDYAGTQACRALKEEGLEVILVNSNPATIMTDKAMADKIYIEPPVSYTHLDVYKRQVMERAMRIAREKGMAVLSHAEEMEISPYDYRLAENLATVRDIALAAHTGAHLHLCHVSTREAMAAIAAAKGAGVWVTCEVAPHHLYFKDSGYRVNPPIRQGADVEALIQACLKGEVDAIATDHAPHTEADKAAGSPGMVGLETAFSVCHTVLCRENGLPLEALSRMTVSYTHL